MNCRGCGTEMGAVGISDAINDAVDEVLQASIRDAEKRGGVCPLCGHSKSAPFWYKKGVRLGLLFACLLLLSAILIVNSYYRSPLRSSLAQIALDRLRHSPDVISALGTPVQPGWLTHGTIQEDETSWGEARLDMPVHGPKGSASVRVIAGKSTGSWVFGELDVLLPREHKKIDLVRGRVEVLDPNAYQSVHTQPAGHPELLPIPMATPSWDGAYPYLVINLFTSASGTPQFTNAISSVKPSLQHPLPVNQFQVDLHSGLFVLRQTDLFITDTMPISLTRTYRPWDRRRSAFGIGTNHPYDIAPTGSRNPYTFLLLNLEDGRTIHYSRISVGTGYADAIYRHDETSAEFYGSQIAWNGAGWTLRFPGGREILFPESYNAKNLAQGAPLEMRDGQGHGVKFIRDSQRNLTELISPSGYRMTFKYDEAARIIEARDDVGDVRKYSYGPEGLLETVSDGSHVLYRFRYQDLLDAPGYEKYLMASITDGEDRLLLRNTYADGSRVSQQTLANGDTFRCAYDIDSRGDMHESSVTLPNGATKRFSFVPSKPACRTE